MFTGLVELCGALRQIVRRGPGATLTVGAAPAFVAELSEGESVAIDGACLTVTGRGADRFSADVSAETLACTTLGERRAGDALHLERALRLGDRLGGHLVSGHVDAVGTLRERAPAGEALRLTFLAPPAVHRYLIPKGSVAVDGVSLTVNEVGPESFSVVLIPHTQGVVRLHRRPLGARVNLEADLIGKYVERLLAPREARQGEGGVSWEALARAGFLGQDPGR